MLQFPVGRFFDHPVIQSDLTDGRQPRSVLANKICYLVRLIQIQVRWIKSGRRLEHRIFFGQLNIFSGIRKIFANGNNRFHTSPASPFEHRRSVFIKAGVTHMRMHVNQSMF